MEKADYNIASVAKAFQLVDLLSRRNGQLSVQDLAKRLNVSPSNVTRLLQTMQDAGYVEKSRKTNRYILGNKFYVITSNMMNSNDFIQKYLPVTHRIAEKLNATVTLNSLYEKNAVMLTRTIGFNNHRSTEFKAGNMTPAYCSSAGKAMLSLFPEHVLESYLQNWELEHFQSNTITNLSKLLAELELIRKNGYAMDREERYAGLISLSFALSEYAQPYAFTVIMPASRQRELFSPETISYIQKCLQEAE